MVLVRFYPYSSNSKITHNELSQTIKVCLIIASNLYNYQNGTDVRLYLNLLKH